MNELSVTRRDLLKGAGVGALGLAGLSTGSVPAGAHEKIDRPATDLLGPIQVPADSAAGFNYPYYLYLPETTQTEPVPMLVEPNNTGTTSDDLDVHRSAVEDRLRDGLGPQLYSKALFVPLLVPVFPRPAGEIAPSGTYTHALDEDSVELEETELERVDRQLVSMIDHAQALLADLSYPVTDDVLMNGFSASGNFVNRFAALHPERVRSLSGGGINGTPILPLERAKGHRLDYPVGVADIEEITGEPFDAANWREVSQFLYLGGEDENDTIPYRDAWSKRHQRVAVDVYGEDMQDERMPYSEAVYEEAGADATFEIYEGVGHTSAPLQIQQDIANFHRRTAELKQVSFTERPRFGDTTVRFDTYVFADQSYELRVLSADRGDITGSAASVTTGEEATAEVTLSSALDDEKIRGVVVPAGIADPEGAVATVSASVRELPLLRVVDAPTESRPRITVEYGVASSPQTGSSPHIYIEDSSGSRAMLRPFRPGTVQTETFDLSRDVSGVTVADGQELSLTLIDVDDGSELESASVVVGTGGGEKGTAHGSRSIEFATQPTTAQEEFEVTYHVEEGDEPDTLTLQSRIGEDTTVLLGSPTVGREVTESFSVEKIPKTAGDDVTVEVVAGRTLAADRTTILRDTGGAVSVGYTDPPTDDDPSGTVRFSVDESYVVADALTLRVYDGTLYGADPGDAFALFHPGDEGTATFTLGNDVDADIEDPVVAVVDDVPLARATTDDIVDAPETGEESDQTSTGDQDSNEESDDQTDSEDGDDQTDSEEGDRTPTPEQGESRATAETPTETPETQATDRTPTDEQGAGQEATRTLTDEPMDTPATDTGLTDTSSPGRETDREQPPTASDQPDEATAETDDRGSTTTGSGGPGFGIGSALASLGGLSYLLRNGLDETSPDREVSDGDESRR